MRQDNLFTAPDPIKPVNVSKTDIDHAIANGLRVSACTEYTATGVERGYHAKGYGPYAPGGNPVIAGPVRRTLGEAINDVADPSSVPWRVIGHLCG